MADLLDALMRGYPGIFSFPLPVDESSLAHTCGVSVPQLRVLLYNLSLEHVIRYIPADHSSVIYLHHDRLRPGNVALSPTKYEQLKNAYHERSEAMLQYASETDVCRAQFLLRYFGQSESDPCGTCDLCRAGLAAGSADLRKATEDWLREMISSRKGSYSIDDLKSSFESSQLSLSPDWVTILRALIDVGEVPAPTVR
jgi:ATP-dependent DNA helicase RecQ